MIDPLVNLDDANSIALRYFSPAADSLWHWADNGQTLAWRGGATIAFRQEVLHVLSRLACSGLPPMGAVVLLLAACRDAWADRDGGKDLLLEYARSARFIPSTFIAEVERVARGLDGVHALEPKLRRSADAKAILAEAIFETSPRQLSPPESGATLGAMAAGLNEELMTGGASHDARRQFELDIRSLREGLHKITPRRLALRARTGLDEPPKPGDIKLSASLRVRSLLAELRDDRELSALAALASNLMAAVHVPKALRQRDELPLGGVSDLSNRGALDRLLMSELAHDDLTLAVRIALNEALYLRREAPPRNPPRERAILIDCGIRLWGVPRVFATAVALALAATADAKCELFTFRARRDGAMPIDLGSREGLTSQLEALENLPHPGAAVQPFFNTLRDFTSDACDAILITHEDVLNDPDFLRCCNAIEGLNWHVATVSRDGKFRLIHMNRSGQRLVCEAAMSLDNISAPAESARPVTALIASAADPKLPVILSTRPFPFLLQQQVESRLAGVSGKQGLVGVTKDGRLMHWRREHQGGRQLSDVVPRGKVLAVFVADSDPQALVVIQLAHAGNVVMMAVNLDTGRCPTATLKTTESQPVGVALHGDLLLLIYRSNVDAFSARTGDFAAKVAIPSGINWTHGRYFWGSGAFHVIAYDGLRLWFEKLSPPQGSVLRMFDRQGMDGPLALMRDGRIDIPNQKAVLSVARPFSIIKRVIGVSPEGHRLIVNSWEAAAPANFLLDLNTTDGWKRVYGDPAEALLAPLIYRSTRSGRTLRHNFQGIWATTGGELALLSKKDHVMVVSLERQQMVLIDRGRLANDEKPVRFSPAAGPAGTRYELGVAIWKDGSRAYLDSRGLLHLKSSDANLPEISLVLSNGPMAGWSCDFERFGEEFFFDGPPTSDAAAFHASIKTFLARVR